MVYEGQQGTYGKFANLSIIDAHDLVVFRSTETQTRDEVQNKQNHTAQDERIGESRDGVGKLVSQLNIVVVEPATGNLGGAIEMRDVVALTNVSSFLQLEFKRCR